MSWWLGAVVALVLLVVVVVVTRMRRAGDAPAPVAAPPRAPPRVPPVIAGRDDEDDEPTVAARVGLPKIPHDPASQRAAIVEAISPEHETDEESEEHTGVIQLILVSAVGRTDAGRKRQNNEDSFLILEDQNLFVVADGMGGHAGGEIASKLAVDSVQRIFLEQEFAGTRKTTRYRRGNELLRAVELANDAVRAQAAADPSLAGMGTTFVGARFSPNRKRVYIAHAGDSRAYRLRNSAFEQLTKDHTLGEEAGAKGALGAQLTRGIGVSDSVRPDLFVGDAEPGDHYLLCSDGLNKMLKDEEIRECILGNDIALAAQVLVSSANDRGGRDNVTVLLIRVDEAPRLKG